MDYDQRPRLVFWETTKACPLACVHCRATAQPTGLPGELTTAEGVALIDEIAGWGAPRSILVLTGGDVLSRGDWRTLVAHAHDRGVLVALAPSVSELLDDEALTFLEAHGVSSISLSLDGSTSEMHDGIRQVEHHFDKTLLALDELDRRGFKSQVNTTVMARNATDLADVMALLVEHGVHVWEVFFLIEVGRGDDVGDLSAEDCNDVCHFLVDAARYGITVRTVEGPFFRRVNRLRAEHGVEHFKTGALYEHLSRRLVDLLGEPRLPVRAPTVATRDGKGIVFVAHDGDVLPSGFLPVAAGNIREDSLTEIYRNSKEFDDLRHADFAAPCGSCEDHDLCGGSRARAFAATGNMFDADPSCVLSVSAPARHVTHVRGPRVAVRSGV